MSEVELLGVGLVLALGEDLELGLHASNLGWALRARAWVGLSYILDKGTRILRGKMSESSDRESHDPLAFGSEDTESEEPNEYVCSEDESSQTEGVVECIIERGEPSVDSGSEAYREMQMNYTKLEAIVDWVLALSHTLEVGSSNQASPLRFVGVAMASASEGVDIRVGVLLARRNTLSEVRLAELRTDYSVSPYVGLRLPTAVDVVRYPPEGSLLIFTDMYQHSFKLPFHPLV
ncbi:unnamed protein product [Prunus armeniaca]